MKKPKIIQEDKVGSPVVIQTDDAAVSVLTGAAIDTRIVISKIKPHARMIVHQIDHTTIIVEVG